MSDTEGGHENIPNGAALAAFLGAGIGSFALGFIVILNQIGVFAVPALYPPAGGVSSRTTLAVVVWLIGWAILHNRWKDRHVTSPRVLVLSFILIGLGILLNFPPVWSLF